eukprot:scaffold118557_cov14-Tisochrysis_lutea.AAC.1
MKGAWMQARASWMLLGSPGGRRCTDQGAKHVSLPTKFPGVCAGDLRVAHSDLQLFMRTLAKVLRKFATHGEAGACRRLGPGETQGGEGEDAEADPDLKEDYNPEEIAELQAKLDADLADMFSQLQVCVHVFVASVASAQNVRAPARWRPARWVQIVSLEFRTGDMI